MRKRKPELEADLDPPNTRRTRPGGFAAVRAVEATRADGKAPAKSAPSKATTQKRRRGFAGLEADLDPVNTSRTRPGGFAAARAVEATKPKPRSKKR